MTRHGRFEWYELVTVDGAPAASFYAAVLGWTAEDAGHPGVAYTLMKSGAAPAAGLLEPPPPFRDGLQPFWLGYVSVDDVDAATHAASEAGARVHQAPTDMAGVGRFSMIVDPQGATLTLFRRSTPVPAVPLAGRPGHAGWHELVAADWPAAFAFYGRLFGWTKAEAVDMGRFGTYQLFACGDEVIGGMMNGPAGSEAPPRWDYYFQVGDIQVAAEQVAASGGAVLHGPVPVPGGRSIVKARDPQGATVSFISADANS